MSSRKKFAGNAAMLYVMAIAQQIFPLFTFPYLTRVLEPDLYAVITYLTAVMSYIRIFNKFGFDLSSTKRIAENRGDSAALSRIFGSTLQANSVLAVLSSSVYTLLVFLIPIMRDNMLLAYLYLIGVLLEVLLPDFLFLGLQRMESVTIRFIVARTISTALTFALVRTRQDVYWVPLLNIFGTSVAVGLTWYQIRFRLKVRAVFSAWREAFRLLRESAVYFVSKFAATAFGVTNTFVLGVFEQSLEQIAFWSVSYNLINSATSLYTPIISSLYPHMAARRDTKLIRWLLYGLLPLIAVVTALVYAFSGQVIDLFCGVKYHGAVPVFRALLPVLVFAFPAQVIGFPVLGTIGKVKETTKSTVIAAVFHISGLFLLLALGRFTVLHIAVLRSGTEAVLFGVRSWYLWNYRRRRNRERLQ